MSAQSTSPSTGVTPSKPASSPAKKILLLNGPNLNLLGTREPGIYGSDTLPMIEQRATAHARALGAELTAFQTNFEGELIERIHRARDEGVVGIVINAGAFTHQSVAIRDALNGVAIPFVEVHISNVYKREPFRHKSYLSDVAVAVICGMGPFGYIAAVEFLVNHL